MPGLLCRTNSSSCDERLIQMAHPPRNSPSSPSHCSCSSFLATPRSLKAIHRGKRHAALVFLLSLAPSRWRSYISCSISRSCFGSPKMQNRAAWTARCGSFSSCLPASSALPSTCSRAPKGTSFNARRVATSGCKRVEYVRTVQTLEVTSQLYSASCRVDDHRRGGQLPPTGGSSDGLAICPRRLFLSMGWSANVEG